MTENSSPGAIGKSGAFGDYFEVYRVFFCFAFDSHRIIYIGGGDHHLSKKPTANACTLPFCRRRATVLALSIAAQPSAPVFRRRLVRRETIIHRFPRPKTGISRTTGLGQIQKALTTEFPSEPVRSDAIGIG